MLFLFSWSVVTDSMQLPWTAARQASLSITASQSLPKLMSIKSVMHPTISSSVVPFSCLQSFPTSGSFRMSQFFELGGQNIGVSASASVLPMNIQDWFPFRWTGVISLQSKLNIYGKHPTTVYTVALKTYRNRRPALENADIFRIYPTCQTLLRTLMF